MPVLEKFWEEPKPPPTKKKAKKSPVGKRELTCESCGLAEKCKSPVMEYHGRGRKKVLFLAEAPGPDEDDEDDQLVGRAGQLLRKSLRFAGLDFERDAWRLNGINCYPGRDAKGKIKAPTNHQINCCRKEVTGPTIKLLDPDFIVPMGNHALQSLWGENHSDLSITKFRGRAFPDKKTGAWVLPLFHPSFILRNEGNQILDILWRRDLRKLIDRINTWEKPEFPDPVEQIDVVTDLTEILDTLRDINKRAEHIVFDYETSGLKPFRKGHKIHSIAVVAYIPGEARRCLSFPFQYPGHFGEVAQTLIEAEWVTVLKNPKIKKVAHNLKFEDLWTRVILDCMIEGWDWCTMVNQHIIDNTQGTTSLKWQAWERWGIYGYDAEFRKYASATLTKEQKEAGVKHNSTHDFNRVHEIPMESLLLYGGYDGILTSWLYDDQQEQMPKESPMRPAKDLFHNGLMTFCDQGEEGVPVDVEYYDRAEGEFLGEANGIEEALMGSPEAGLFLAEEERPINLASQPDLRKLLFTHLDHEPFKETVMGSASVDAESMDKLDIPFAKDLVEMRKLRKIVAYFDQIRREAHGGKVHPITNLNMARTFRPSINDPNFANVPKREKRAKMAVRLGIRVPPGYCMMANDYGGIEVHGLEWYSHDRELLKYLQQPDSDMHRDQAQNVFMIKPKDWEKLNGDDKGLLRFYEKNLNVFPLFYGSWYKPCAEDLWRICGPLSIGDDDGTTLWEWLDMSYPDFESHVKDCEHQFWELFKGVRDWQNSLHEEYKANGYIETYLGFRYRGWLTRNQLYNYKIQGTAFHVLMWAMNELHRMSIERGWKSYIMWQIYDQLISAVWPTELKEVVEAYEEVMVERAPKQFPWINTPLKVDHETTEVDGTFADLAHFEERDDSSFDESVE